MKPPDTMNTLWTLGAIFMIQATRHARDLGFQLQRRAATRLGFAGSLTSIWGSQGQDFGVK